MTSFTPPNIADISIWLDSYDDLFSDFDPRPYAKRTLSDDFLVQVRKLARDQDGKPMRLSLLMPETGRNTQNEEVIVKSLHSSFQHTYEVLKDEKKRTIRRGIQLTVTGVALMLAAGYLSLQKEEKYYLHLLVILLEPAGWFLLWMGLDTLVYSTRRTLKDMQFYEKAAEAEISFGTY